jgi:UDP-4-amino-4-deoxy-L-arabinose formyltransferase/UDP-glucuronic acid dehydrogenase (UDP-4-keto-hexauronic acid decarboxylating)
MKTVVFAYHNMGLAGLDALVRHGFQIQAVFTHRDDPRENCWFGSVANWASEKGICVFSPENVNRPEEIERGVAFAPEAIFSFYYRHLICQSILDLPPAGAFNLHGSLLPAYRGRAPINWVLVQGEEKTGVTLHYMVKKADAGPIVGQRPVPIDRQDTALTLYKKMCVAAGVLLDDLLPLIKAGRAPCIPQDESRATVCRGRRPEDGRIDWQWTAERIYNLIRAVTDPYPGAFTLLPNGEKLMVWWGVPEGGQKRSGSPGEVFLRDGRVKGQTGEGCLILEDVEADGRRMSQPYEIYGYFKKEERVLLR